MILCLEIKNEERINIKDLFLRKNFLIFTENVFPDPKLRILRNTTSRARLFNLTLVIINFDSYS